MEFFMSSFGKIKIIKICSYFMRMRLSEKVWMYFTFHMSRYTNCRTPKMCSFFVGWTESHLRNYFSIDSLYFMVCRLLSMACSTIISCMFNLMIVMCSPEIVSVFVHVFDQSSSISNFSHITTKNCKHLVSFYQNIIVR